MSFWPCGSCIGIAGATVSAKTRPAVTSAAANASPPITWASLWRSCGSIEMLRQFVQALAPAGFHSVEHALDDSCRALGVGHKGHPCAAALVREGYGRHTLEQLLSVGIEGNVGEAQALVLYDLPENSAHRMPRAVGRLHDDSQPAANPGIDGTLRNRKASWTEPLRQVLWFGPGSEHKSARRLQFARDRQ